MTYKRWMKAKIKSKKIIKTIICISFAFLPFIYLTQLIGFNTFIDSFENPEYYVNIPANDIVKNIQIGSNYYLIIQKSTHPSFEINENDFIIYFNYNGELICNYVTQINSISAARKYYITNDLDLLNNAVFDNQIVGKVTNIISDNIINSISLRIWEISINNLNIRAIISN